MKENVASTNYINSHELQKELVKLRETYLEEVEYFVKENKTPHMSKRDEKKIREKAERESKGTVSDELGMMFIKIATNLSNKNNFKNYTFKEDMIGRGIMFLCMYAKNFNYKKKNANAFAYVSQICYNGFIQYIKKEKKYSEAKDDIIKKNMEVTELEKWEQENNE